MTQVEYQASQAEERSQETRSFVRQVRAATRRKYTPEEKIRIVLEGFRRETTVNDLCRRGEAGSWRLGSPTTEAYRSPPPQSIVS